jgi:hypothetical protein
MSPYLITLLSRLSPAAWAAAVAGVWLLPVRAVIVVTGIAVAGTLTAAVSAADAGSRGLLIAALAEATRHAAPRIREVPARRRAM